MGAVAVRDAVIRLSGKPRPSVLYIGTPTYDLPEPQAKQTGTRVLLPPPLRRRRCCCFLLLAAAADLNMVIRSRLCGAGLRYQCTAADIRPARKSQHRGGSRVDLCRGRNPRQWWQSTIRSGALGRVGYCGAVAGSDGVRKGDVWR